MKIYQIEVSNYCNYSCAYCPHPKQKRLKGMMSFEVFQNAVELAGICGQTLLYLHNFGEPLLHPQLAQFIAYAANKGIECRFFTNAELLTEKMAGKLYDAGLRKISVSAHNHKAVAALQDSLRQSEKALVIEEMYQVDEIHDWAGQAQSDLCNHHARKSEEPCIFQRENAFVILWNGDIAACCIDCDGISVRHTISDLIKKKTYQFQSFCLCDACDLMRGSEQL